ncbi:acyl-CoA dehydrogenase family protein [soil metagenome]
MPDSTPTPAPAPTNDQLAERFRPVFTRIAETAVHREQHRELAHDPVRWLSEAGFGAVRVPTSLGGFGASFEQFFDLRTELAEADSNVPQILRAHFGFIERLFSEVDGTQHHRRLKLAAGGTIFGNATTELGDVALGKLKTRLYREGDGWLLEGDKFYSTGTLYADWVGVAAERELPGSPGTSERVLVQVPTDAPGVERLDDWRGFGQRLSASGTTRFRNVRVQDDQILSSGRAGPTSMTAFFQLVHLATLAGIARAIERDAVAFVQKRKRVYSFGSGTSPREDPLVQQVIGQLASAAFIGASAVQAVARGLGDIDRLRVRGEPVPNALLVDVELRMMKAQVGVPDAVLGAATRLFDVGGASALQEDLRLDRHWRNARTLASHNPTIYKARVVGDHALNGKEPTFYWSVGTSEG